MLNRPLITLGKTLSKASQLMNRGNGSTWPGHIALQANKQFVKQILAKSPTQVIIVAGTNGKTTTASMIAHALQKQGRKVLQNDSGANLLNGIASTILLNTNKHGRITHDYAVFEVDENALPQVLQQMHPDYVVLLNLFRDQLDRYGEINAITSKWNRAIASLTKKTKLILNADDPQIAYLAHAMEYQTNAKYFAVQGDEEKKPSADAADALSCPRCGEPLIFMSLTFSHLGNWTCKSCQFSHPKPAIDAFPEYPLSGLYNRYNTHATALVLKEAGLKPNQIEQSLRTFKPAFGRQELVQYKNRNVQLFLSKNPTSFNQSFATIKDLKARTLLIVLNDRIPDGRDVSWIWDTDLSGIDQFERIIVAGDRVYDMALRIKYENYAKIETFEKIEDAVEEGVKSVTASETLFILPTYSAMLEVRKILTGKKIL